MKFFFNLFCFLITAHLYAQNLSFTFRVELPRKPLEADKDSILLFQKNITQDATIQYLFVSMAYGESLNGYLTLVDCGETRKWAFADEKGKPIVFRSQADLFNYLYKNDWEHQQTLENTQTNNYWAQVFFKVNVIQTKHTHLFKRRPK